MNSLTLNSPVYSIKGIGEKKAELLKKLRIESVRDLLYHFPRNYIDKRILTDVENLTEGYHTVKVVIKKQVSEHRTKQGLIISKCTGEDATGKVDLIWYNNRFVKNYIKAGEEYYFYGKIKRFSGRFSMEYPEYEGEKEEESLNLLRIVPEYPLCAGLTQKELRKWMDGAINQIIGSLQDLFPERIRSRQDLAEYNFALKNLHQPDSDYALELALTRFKYEEFFMLFSGLEHLRREMPDRKKGISFINQEATLALMESLPFSLTNAQVRVFHEIMTDMKSELNMNRLLQGDVGSGKTIIAALAMHNCVKNGHQAVIIAPTEILGKQHFHSLSELFKEENIKIGLLTGGMRKKEKTKLLEELESGEVQLLVATHAVLEENVVFKNLGLAITDEQHRFGVRQRMLLAAKGENPDILVMSATPIPRTLTLILYGDLDVSIIDELPPGRKPIDTLYIDSNKVERMYGFIKKEVEAGHQVYFVCPLVEENETSELKSAVSHWQFLQEEVFPELKVSMIHGKMKAAEKSGIMEEFTKGSINILVSTTVIEVGVNIPNATVMVVENAERFGMAQLHQLRGRIGRGSDKSYCIFISDSKTETAVDRLKFLTKSQDGFKIAEKDLETRGSGEILGLKQHGLPDLMLADIVRDNELLLAAKQMVKEVYSVDYYDVPEYKTLRGILEQRFEKKLKEIAMN